MFDFTITDRQIVVDDKYFGRDSLNEYFTNHKLKADYPMEQVKELIDTVAFMLDGLAENSDCLMIEDMLES